jgi:hypothetical protein
VKSIAIVLMICLVATFSACGGNSSSGQNSALFSGNWQFAMTTSGTSFVTSPLEGGFLLQNKGALSGQLVFSLWLPGATSPCNSGSAAVTGTVTGQAVTLSAVVGTLDQNGNSSTQTIALTGTIASNSTLQGSYTLTAGYAIVNRQLVPCGTGQDAGTWTATLVPTLSGAFQGFFHSRTGSAGLADQNFPLSGRLTQGDNIGASYATVSGTLVFQNPATTLNDYPCIGTAFVTGQISGSNVILQVFANTGLVVGQIGGTPPQQSPVTFANTTSGGPVLQSQNTNSTLYGYSLTTSACPAGSGFIGDTGDICLAFNGGTGCTQPIILSPLSVAFVPQLLQSTPTTQTVTITNTTSAPLNGVTLSALEIDSGNFYQSQSPNGGGVVGTGGDFNGLLSFIIVPTGQPTDCTSLAPFGSPFDLQTSCTITVQFQPQESCPWMPLPFEGSSTPPFAEKPALCPSTLAAKLTVTVPAGSSQDADNSFALPITGGGMSAIVPSTGELDFSAEALGEASQPQTLTFTNQSANAVQILPGGNTCALLTQQALPYPLTFASPVAGFQIARTAVTGTVTIFPNLSQSPPTVNYFCDYDAQGKQPNFQISPESTCVSSAGLLLGPQQSCTLQVTYVPQPGTDQNGTNSIGGPDYFLELNTVQCNSGESSCEIDSGRFPVEITANPPSPLRTLPNAGLEFGTVPKGTPSNPLNVTLFNDPADPNSATVTLSGLLVSGNYTQTNNCPPTLAPNTSCTISVIFTPGSVGLNTGTIKISYNTPGQIGLIQQIYMRGTGE